jgi:hypothetical protein
MTTETRPLNAVQSLVLQATENPQLDERLWKAWIERNEKRDKVRFLRRVRVTVILASLISLATLVQKLG